VLIGLDFDNTIVSYEGVFTRWAREQGLPEQVAESGKTAIRNWLRKQGREDLWTILQGEVYGSRMGDAVEAAGVDMFLSKAGQAGHRVVVVSHRTQKPYLGPPVDLHAAARKWWEHRPIAKAVEQIYFETSAEKKAERIRILGCDAFVDDLWEFLERPDLPHGMRRIWYGGGGSEVVKVGLERAASWQEVSERLLPP